MNLEYKSREQLMEEFNKLLGVKDYQRLSTDGLYEKLQELSYEDRAKALELGKLISRMG